MRYHYEVVQHNPQQPATGSLTDKLNRLGAKGYRVVEIKSNDHGLVSAVMELAIDEKPEA